MHPLSYNTCNHAEATGISNSMPLCRGTLSERLQPGSLCALQGSAPASVSAFPPLGGLGVLAELMEDLTSRTESYLLSSQFSFFFILNSSFNGYLTSPDPTLYMPASAPPGHLAACPTSVRHTFFPGTDILFLRARPHSPLHTCRVFHIIGRSQLRPTSWLYRLSSHPGRQRCRLPRCLHEPIPPRAFRPYKLPPRHATAGARNADSVPGCKDGCGGQSESAGFTTSPR